MPSSYTPSLRLVLPVQGELNGQWGNTVNNGLTSLVDAAIAGTATVSMSDANHTLTTANEAADQARNMFIRLTGTLSAQRNVICPAVSKLYFVINNTTGGFGINFKTSAGTGVVVPNGARMSLYCDGTNVVAATTPVELADGAVTTPKLANDAVTFAKLQDIATARILGRATAGTGDVEELTGAGDVEELTGAQAQSLLPVQQTRVDVASAISINLTTAAPNTDHINITGTTTITGFTVAAGRLIFVRFAGALTLTNNASIVTQTGANILTQAGDTCILRATAANTVEVLCYARSRSAGINLGTEVASTSGTAVDFTGIPSWAKRITVMFSGVSTNGASLTQIQLGDAGGVETSGYSAALGTQGLTSGFPLWQSALAAASVMQCVVQLHRFNLETNTWVASTNSTISSANTGLAGAGSKTLSGPLTQIRITTVNGTDTFDAGSINISWEF